MRHFMNLLLAALILGAPLSGCMPTSQFVNPASKNYLEHPQTSGPEMEANASNGVLVLVTAAYAPPGNSSQFSVYLSCTSNDEAAAELVEAHLLTDSGLSLTTNDHGLRCSETTDAGRGFLHFRSDDVSRLIKQRSANLHLLLRVKGKMIAFSLPLHRKTVWVWPT